MKNKHKKFLKEASALCKKYKCHIHNDKLLFTEDMPATDEYTGTYQIISIHEAGVDYKHLAISIEDDSISLEW